MRYFLFIILLASCVETPIIPEKSKSEPVSDNYVLILNEGLWGMNNTSVTAVDMNTGLVQNSYLAGFSGENTGDTGNDITLKNDKLFVALHGNKSVRKFDIRTGKMAGELHLKSGGAPSAIEIFNDTTAYLSDLFNSRVIEFNPQSMEIIKDYQCGPYPAGLAVSEKYIFTANSGYGDFYPDEPGAGTISVIDRQTGTEIKQLDCGPNPNELALDEENGFLYACYYHLPSMDDSLGGIVKYSLEDFREVARIRAYATGIYLWDSNIYFLEQPRPGSEKNTFRGISKADFETGLTLKLIENPAKDIWYSLSVIENAGSAQFWVGNAFDFQSAGEIILFDFHSGHEINRFESGQNPNKIIHSNQGF
jgi:hypothetical protein